MNNNQILIMPSLNYRFPYFRHRLDTFRSYSILQCNVTKQKLILSIELKKQNPDNNELVYNVSHQIKDMNTHKLLSSIPISNSEEAKYLYHMFRKLNPQFIDITPK